MFRKRDLHMFWDTCATPIELSGVRRMKPRTCSDGWATVKKTETHPDLDALSVVRIPIDRGEGRICTKAQVDSEEATK